MPKKTGRSLIPSVVATIDYDTQILEINFNKPVGDADITVAGASWSTNITCDTNLQHAVTIHVPIQANSNAKYTIYIEGLNYRGYGEFYSKVGVQTQTKH